jgi:predicted nucleic acid-binding protein
LGKQGHSLTSGGTVRLIVDTGPFSNFLFSQQLQLLQAISQGPILLPASVVGEIRRGAAKTEEWLARHGAATPDAARHRERLAHYQTLDDLLARSTITEVTPTAGELRVAHSLPFGLDDAERDCLAIALTRGWQVALDDGVAAQTGLQRGAPVTGTPGLLVSAVRAGLIEEIEANAVFEAIRLHWRRCPKFTISDCLQRAVPYW